MLYEQRPAGDVLYRSVQKVCATQLQKSDAEHALQTVRGDERR